MSALLAALVGGLTGFLSGLGIGGGTLLILCLTAFFGLSQREAQGINLLYFLPTAASATVLHLKNGLVDKKIAIPAILAGMVAVFPAALAATAMDTAVLRKIFGALVTLIGLRELFGKSRA